MNAPDRLRAAGRRARGILTLGPRLATVGASPADRLRLFALGALAPLLTATGTLSRRTTRVRVRLQDQTFEIALRDASELVVLAASRVDEMIPPDHIDPAVVVDCGAHIGTVTLQYRARYPRASIYAVEPDRDTLRRLRHNAGGLPGVTIFEGAVSGATGTAEFAHAADSWSSSLARFADPDETAGTTVDTISLDDFMCRHDLAAIDLLKLDVEGAELEVLRASRELHRVGLIVGEIHYDLGRFTESDLRESLPGFDVTLVPHSRDRALLHAVRRG